MMIDGNTLSKALKDGLWKGFIDGRPVTVEELNIGTNSVNLTLGHKLLKQCRGGNVDPVDEPNSLTWETVLPNANGKFLLLPGDFCLGTARERFEAHEPLWITHQMQRKVPGYADLFRHDTVQMQMYFVPMFDGRSTIGRLGIGTHVTAGFGDYGFGANFTMEIFNISSRPMLLTPGMQIAQLHFESVTPEVSSMFYKGAYAGKNGGPHAPVLGRDRFMK